MALRVDIARAFLLNINDRYCRGGKTSTSMATGHLKIGGTPPIHSASTSAEDTSTKGIDFGEVTT